MAPRKNKKEVEVETPTELNDSEVDAESDLIDKTDRTRVIILEISLCDTELGSFKPGDKYPCTESTANRMIKRKLAKVAE